MTAWLAHLSSWWQARLPREQRVLAIGALVLTLVLWIGLVIVPLQSQVQRLQSELPALRETNASLNAMARQAALLTDTPIETQLPAEQREAALRRSLERAALGDPKSIAITKDDSERLRVRCDDTDYGQWLAWLHEVRSQLGSQIEHVSVTARPANGITGRVRAEVVLSWAERVEGGHLEGGHP